MNALIVSVKQSILDLVGFQPKHDSHDEACNGVRGLENLGNTCFLNAVLQSLSDLRVFESMKPLMSDERSRSILNHESMPFTLELMKCLQELRNSNVQHAVKPRALLKILMDKEPNFRGHQQQDAHEAFQVIVSIVSNELKLLRDIKYNTGLAQIDWDKFGPADCIGSRHRSIATHSSEGKVWLNPFEGLLSSQLICDKCKYNGKPIRNQCIYNLSLPIPKGKPGGNDTSISLVDCLVDFTNDECINDVECSNCSYLSAKKEIDDSIEREKLLLSNGLECMNNIDVLLGQLEYVQSLSRRGQSDTLLVDLDDSDASDHPNSFDIVRLKSKTIKRVAISRLPKVLCVHLCRLNYDHSIQRMVKIKRFVKFPEYLDMRPYFRSHFSALDGLQNLDQLPPLLYQLRSVIVHHGNEGSGHYISYSSVNGNWFAISDGDFYAVELRDVLKSQAYMMFYEKVD